MTLVHGISDNINIQSVVGWFSDTYGLGLLILEGEELHYGIPSSEVFRSHSSPFTLATTVVSAAPDWGKDGHMGVNPSQTKAIP